MGASRDSANIINDQINSINKNSNSLDAMHDVKLNAYKIKEYLLKADLKSVSDIFSASWEAKKRTSKSITNQTIDNIEKEIMSSGANSMKVSGAGGGGFIMIFADPEKKLKIENLLSTFNGHCQNFNFTNSGSISWKI